MRHPLIAFALCCLFALPASAAEIIVFAPNPFTPVFQDLIPNFEAQSGNRVTVVRDTAGGLVRRMAKSETYDLALISQTAATALAESGSLLPDSTQPVAKSGIGLAVPDGAPIPDISTVDGFVHTLLAARAVAYTDPAAGGSSGIYLTALFNRLGIADALRPKSVLVQGGLAAEQLVDGQATVALQQASEVMAVKGAHYVGPIPATVQFYTTYDAVIARQSPHADAARSFVAVLKGPAGVASLAHHGLDQP
jgi:molybdate transport system substrate-binding protein